MRSAVAKALSGTPVLAAWLFGSRAHGSAGPESDTDIAVLLPRGTTATAALVGELTIRLEDAGLERPDVHVLNGTALAFQAEAVMRGERIFSASEEDRVLYEVWVTTRYLDFEPVLELQYRIQRRRLAAGERLGRPIGG